MPKSSRSITPKSSSKNHRQHAPASKAASASKVTKNGHHKKSEKVEAKNGHKNGAKNGHKPDEKTGVATPSKSIADSHEKDAKGVQAVWTGQPERQERLRDLVKLAKDQGYLTWDDLNEAIPESVNNPEELEAIIMFLRNLEIDVIDASEVDRYKQTAAGHGGGAFRGGEDRREARHPRRSRPDVSQADGPGAAADPRAGSRDFQADRGRREPWCKSI